MTINYFLGANSCRGFFSLYDGFPPAGGGMLHIIKGGPGTGKSGFMRRLAQAAEALGMDTERVLCSGDPASLDGLYIPELGEGWVDGTAPHVREPACFGVDADYVNLGRFCRLPLSTADAERVRTLSREYRALYSSAYDCLAAVSRLRAAAPRQLLDGSAAQTVVRRIRGALRNARNGDGSERRVFLSALSCQGRVRLGEEARRLCPLIYELDDGLGAAAEALALAQREARERGLRMLCCPDPLDPERLEALLLPEAGLGFAAGDWDLSRSRHMRIDALVPAGEARELRAQRRRYAVAERAAMETALEDLAHAKSLHDELELVYRPYMDFAALDRYTGSEIQRLQK